MRQPDLDPEPATRSVRRRTRLAGYLTADMLLHSKTELQGLCIDDFFCAHVSVESAGVDLADSKAKKAYDRAQTAYARHSLLGSPQKDIVAADSGKRLGLS